jgi:hypothetical protein
MLQNLTKTASKKKKDKKEEEENEKLKNKIFMVDSKNMIKVFKGYLNQCVQSKEVS